MSTATTHPSETLLVSVTRGNPAPAELAAVLAVLLTARSAAAAAAAPAAEVAGNSRWAEHAFVRATLPRPGPGSWRASAQPR